MRRFSDLLILSTAMLALATKLGNAQDPPPSDKDGMILFSYWPKEGKEQAFHDGYAKHLDWHRANDDPILWYAWDVIVGSRTGLFVDGAFDIPFAALDQRVKPAADAADFVATAAPFATINDRVLYRLRSDLSSGLPLENREPGRMMEAVFVTVRVGRRDTFESILMSLKPSGSKPVTCYQVIAGGRHPGYLLLVQHGSWSEIGEGGGGIESIVDDAGTDSTMTLLTDLLASVKTVESEIWRYRADLTYMP